MTAPDPGPTVLDVTRLVDRLRYGRLPTGIDRVCLAYVAHFGGQARALLRWAGRAHCLPVAESRALFRWLLAPRSKRALYALLAVGIARSFFSRRPQAAWLFHTGHAGLEDPLLQSMVMRDQLRLIVMIHDLIPLTHPGFCRRGEDRKHAARLRASLQLAAGIICNSAVTRAELAAWAEGAGLALPPTQVLWLAPAIVQRVARARPLAQPYYVVLGTIEPRKNHALLIAVWARLRAELGERCPRLVVIGQPGWDVDDTLTALRAGAARGEFVLAMDGCDDETTAAWLQSAEALLFPSFVEGYGLPLVEALALDVPVLAADLPVFREIAGERPRYLDPADPAAWAAAIVECESRRPARDGAAAAGFEAPTWPAHFAALAAWQAGLAQNDPPAPVYAPGFSRWKHAAVRTAFAGRELRFVRPEAPIPAGATVAVWGQPPPALAARADLRIHRLEDGFLRSVGLGAELIRPLSWVVDRRGIYYDATTPSDLEVLLETAPFTAAERARAAHFRARVVASGLTKYNLGGSRWTRPATASRVVLAVGQVESDASLRFGAPGLHTNAALVGAVRAEAPDAFLIYKPHPDVIGGLRAAGVGEATIAQQVDAVLPHADLHQLLAEVDEVHVITSLAGFEALLREVRVICHGLPFYAGWGLTEDRCAAPRRSRRLTLDDLVAGALLRYPRYFSRDNRQSVSPEEALDSLLAWRADEARRGPSWWRPLRRAVVKRVVGVR